MPNDDRDDLDIPAYLRETPGYLRRGQTHLTPPAGPSGPIKPPSKPSGPPKVHKQQVDEPAFDRIARRLCWLLAVVLTTAFLLWYGASCAGGAL